ncbi:follistatin-A-like isoform X1 [Saccostrea echinata]|uniref:follistatin-A-like isoform X1 n=2 Tax=Saccostrea echinata TaxID=191078 RepID=UPI002A7EC02E|nr:follistatin-A-like isoform X1 [Saccostrea echinata]
MCDSVKMDANSLIILFLLLAWVGRTQAGTCWLSMTKQKMCFGAFNLNVTKEECCKNPSPYVSWTPQTFTSTGDLFYWQELIGGAPHCELCHDTCEGVKCPRGKHCRIKKGVPKCACLIKCTQGQRRSRKICGTDGRTYNNECQLRRRNCKRETSVSVAYRGVCRQSCKKVRCLDWKRCLEDQNGLPHCVHCQISCPNNDDVRVLCGEDGVTYRNPCELRAAVCRRHRSIRIAYYGKCRANATCLDTGCSEGMSCLINPVNHQPLCALCRSRTCSPMSRYKVCGTDGVDYKNYCHLMQASCKMGIAIDTRHSGSCDRSSWRRKQKHKKRRRRKKKIRGRKRTRYVDAVLRSSDGIRIKLRLKPMHSKDDSGVSLPLTLEHLFSQKHTKENG